MVDGITLGDFAGKDISELKGVGEKRTKAFEQVGVESILDLLQHYPRRYVDRTQRAERSQGFEQFIRRLHAHEADVGVLGECRLDRRRSASTVRIRGICRLVLVERADVPAAESILFGLEPKFARGRFVAQRGHGVGFASPHFDLSRLAAHLCVFVASPDAQGEHRRDAQHTQM
jgi:hypothetical protein